MDLLLVKANLRETPLNLRVLFTQIERKAPSTCVKINTANNSNLNCYVIQMSSTRKYNIIKSNLQICLVSLAVAQTVTLCNISGL